MDARSYFYWIFFVFWISVSIKSSTQTSSSVEKYQSKHHHNLTTTFNESSLPNRDRREAPPEFTIIKHKSRPSKRHPGYRSRRRPKPKPKPVYGPPNFSYGSPISDYTLGYSSKGQTIKNGPASSYSNLDTTHESDFLPPLKTSLYSGHNSYESTFKNSNNYISPPSFPAENYGFSYTPPPLTNNFAEPPILPETHDLAGAGTHSIKSIPPSTNYGVPVAPIHQQPQPQNTQILQSNNINNQQHEYISNLYNSFSAPTTSQSQPFFNSPNLQSIYTNPAILTSAEINAIGVNAISGITGNRGNVPSGISTTNFNQDALNSLTFKSYATSQPPQVKYVPASVTISSSKEITLNRKPPATTFAEPPQNYENSYQTPLTSYEVPIQFDSSKVTYNVNGPENQFEPSIYKSPPKNSQNFWHKSPSTTTERHKYLPPTLPTAYDQNQFNSFSDENDYNNYNKQQSDFLDADSDYGSVFDVPHESKKLHKTKLTKTYAGANLQSEDSSSVESFEIPSDEYVDELIRTTTTKRPRTRGRRTRPTVASTTPHILDTEDLRDAFSSGTVQYSVSVNPREKISKTVDRSQKKVATDKNFVLLSSANKNATWSRPYPKRQQSLFDPVKDVKDFFGTDSSGKTNGSSKGIEILSIQKSKSHSYYAGTVAPPEPFKQKGINSRYDQPKYDDSMFNVVSTNVRMANNANSKLASGAIRSRRTKKQNFEESEEIQDDDSKEVDPIFWNGQKLPDNHKLSKRVA